MKLHMINRRLNRLFAAAALTIAAASGFAQTEGTLAATDDRQRELARIQDRNLERRQTLGKLEAPKGDLVRSRAFTRDLLRSLQEGDLESAARQYFEGVEAGVPAVMERAARTLEEASRQAAADAMKVLRLTGRTPGQGPAPVQDAAGTPLSGAAAAKAAEILESVEAGRKQLQDDLNDYVADVAAMYPELKVRMAEAGLTPDAVRDIAKRSLSEADQLKYRASIFRVNAIIWENLATILKTRALTGGKPQSFPSDSTEDVIAAATSDKVTGNR